MGNGKMASQGPGKSLTISDDMRHYLNRGLGE